MLNVVDIVRLPESVIPLNPLTEALKCLANLDDVGLSPAYLAFLDSAYIQY